MAEKRIPNKGRIESLPRFSPTSLVGSFFHGTPERAWQGAVVAEPHPGFYLVQLFEWAWGEPNGQKIVPLTAMAEWTFYDTIEEMKDYYDAHPKMFQKPGE